MKKTLILLIGVVLSTWAAQAQENLSISGTIKNTKGSEIEAATVFIAGSQKITVTDSKGMFKFQNLTPGTYQIIVNLIGYAAIKKNVLLIDKSVVLDTLMQEKQILLDEVVIGDNNQRKNFMKTFNKYFLGELPNAKACKILNPEKIEFSTIKKLLKARTDDFLIIENRYLGYKIKYLLRNFQYDNAADATFYEGEAIFEDLAGPEDQKVIWKGNRKTAYEGSLMHYLRAVHANRAQEEGFLTYAMLNFEVPITIAPNPLPTEQLIKHVDSNFITFRYKRRLYTLYDKKKAASEQKISNRTDMNIDMADTGSILMLNATVDKRGSYSDYQAILIQGYWGKKRIADQLPMEYEPN